MRIVLMASIKLTWNLKPFSIQSLSDFPCQVHLFINWQHNGFPVTALMCQLNQEMLPMLACVHP